MPFLTEAVSSDVGVSLNMGVTPTHCKPLCKPLSSKKGLLSPLYPQAFGGLCSICWPPSLSPLPAVSLAAAPESLQAPGGQGAGSGVVSSFLHCVLAALGLVPGPS